MPQLAPLSLIVITHAFRNRTKAQKNIVIQRSPLRRDSYLALDYCGDAFSLNFDGYIRVNNVSDKKQHRHGTRTTPGERGYGDR